MSDLKTKNWQWQTKEIRGIKAERYGEPYTANVRIVIVNDEVHVESLLSSLSEQTSMSGVREDMRELEQQIKTLGYNQYFYIRMKNNKKRKVKKIIK